MKEQHSLPALPKGVKPGDAVQVRVRHGHNYGMENPAGTVLKVSAADWQQGHRALELIVEGEDPTPQTPRSQLISMPVAQALTLGLPAAPGDVVVTVEATPWPNDAAARGMQRREELERAVLHSAGGKSIEEVEAFASAFDWEEGDGDPMAWIKTTLPRIKTNYGEAQERAGRVAEAQELAGHLRGELAAVRQELAEAKESAVAAAQQLEARSLELEGISDELLPQAGESLRDATIRINRDLATVREESARLRAELEALKASAAPTPPAPAAAKAKAKE